MYSSARPRAAARNRCLAFASPSPTETSMIDLEELAEKALTAARADRPLGLDRHHSREFEAEARSIDGLPSALVSGLASAAAGADWLKFDRLLPLCRIMPDSEMLPSLRAAAYETLNRPLIEDILSLMTDISLVRRDLDEDPDDESVPVLEHVLLAFPEWDEPRWVADKAVNALAAIGTSGALRVLRDAANRPEWSDLERERLQNVINIAEDRLPDTRS